MAALRRMLQVSTWALAVALVALPVVAVLNGWIGSDRWPLRTLRVNDGLERVDATRLREALLPHAQAGFFAVRLDEAQAVIARLPWVEHAEVRKHWPDVLEVRIVEHRPFARWGDDRLLSEQGKLFPAAGMDVPAGLPLLQGPDARVPDVVALYNESREAFAAGGYTVASLALDSRDSWSLRLGNGIDVVLGSQEARLRLKRFARVLPQLLSRDTRVLARADLRYTNGFALEWDEAARRDAGAASAPPSTPATTAAMTATTTARAHPPQSRPGFHAATFPLPLLTSGSSS